MGEPLEVKSSWLSSRELMEWLREEVVEGGRSVPPAGPGSLDNGSVPCMWGAEVAVPMRGGGAPWTKGVASAGGGRGRDRASSVGDTTGETLSLATPKLLCKLVFSRGVFEVAANPGSAFVCG